MLTNCSYPRIFLRSLILKDLKILFLFIWKPTYNLLLEELEIRYDFSAATRQYTNLFFGSICIKVLQRLKERDFMNGEGTLKMPTRESVGICFTK